MPVCVINTNVPSDKSRDSDLCLQLSKITASTVRKPEQYVMVQVNTDQVMSFGGTQEPCCFARVLSIGNLDPASNANISECIMECLKASLGVDPSRIYIEFHDSERHMMGWNGATF